MNNEAIEDYLKAIYQLQRVETKVATTTLAKRLNISPASVSGMVKKLSTMNLVTHKKYQGVQLTNAGRKIALEVIRHHRLIELFLSEALGVPWDRVHEEAEKWEHVLSEDMEDRIDKLLGYPTHDPHGAPIPSRNGEVPKRSKHRMSDLKDGQLARITEVSDRDADMLRYLGELQLFPGTEFEIIAVAPFEGPFTINLDGNELTIGRKVAGQIRVDVLERI